MSAIASARLVPRRDMTYRHGPVRHFSTDVWVLIKRSIARIGREPETLADVTFLPVIFILMSPTCSAARSSCLAAEAITST